MARISLISNEMIKTDILLAGDYYLDLIFTGLGTFPTLGKEIFSKDFEIIPGGAYNTAIALHRLGVNMIWATDFGNDYFSIFAKRHAMDEGLNPSFFMDHDRPHRKITVSLSYPTDRAFITYNDPDEKIPAVFKAILKVDPKYVFIPGLYYGKDLLVSLVLLKGRGIKLIMDGNTSEDIQYTHPSLRKVLESTSIFMPNSKEILRLSNEEQIEKAIMRIVEYCELVVVKDGANGAYGCTQSERNIIHVEPININPIDTTGAGDVFNAGFLAAWLTGKSLEDSLRWGCVAGGLSTTNLGGTGMRITEKDIISYLDRY